MENNYDWLSLDANAKLFPMNTRAYQHNSYRISFQMTATVNKDFLQQALYFTLERFPMFNMRLKRGFFWYFLEKSPTRALVHAETHDIIKRMTCRTSCIRVMYHEK